MAHLELFAMLVAFITDQRSMQCYPVSFAISVICSTVVLCHKLTDWNNLTLTLATRLFFLILPLNEVPSSQLLALDWKSVSFPHVFIYFLDSRRDV